MYKHNGAAENRFRVGIQKNLTMTKLKFAIACLGLVVLLGCSGTTNDKALKDSTSSTSAATTRTLHTQLPMEKSIHLFDMPKGVTEAEWSAVIKDLNDVIAKMGYPNAGYVFYKVTDDSVKTNRYYFEGIWPAGDDYKKIHDSPAFKQASEKMLPLYNKIKAVELYRKLKRIE